MREVLRVVRLVDDAGKKKRSKKKYWRHTARELAVREAQATQKYEILFYSEQASEVTHFAKK